MIWLRTSVLWCFGGPTKPWMLFVCKQKTAYEVRISDWSSDVCSSDLARGRVAPVERALRPLEHFDALEIHDRAGVHDRIGISDQIGRASSRVRVCHYV